MSLYGLWTAIVITGNLVSFVFLLAHWLRGDDKKTLYWVVCFCLFNPEPFLRDATETRLQDQITNLEKQLSAKSAEKSNET